MSRLPISQLGYEEESEILISGKYTHWQNVIMLFVTEIPTLL
jgi:hypothetical protein